MNRAAFKKFSVPAIIFLASLAVTVGIYSIVKNDIDKQLSLQFENETQEITTLVQGRMNLYDNVVYGAQGLFAASVSVERSEWAAYVQALNTPANYSGISGMLYMARVPQASAAAFPEAIYPKKDSGDYYPITYAASSTQQNAQTGAAGQATTTALGFDASSDPVRWAAMTEAAQTGMPAASGVTLGVTNHQPLFSVYAPIYKNGGGRELEGFVAATFRIGGLFAGLTSDPVFDKNIGVRIYDAPTLAQASATTLLFDTASSSPGGAAAQSGLAQTTGVAVAGRTWTLAFAALPGYRPQSVERYVPAGILVLGGALSLLLAWLIYSYTESRERAELLAKRMTQDFEDSQKLFHLSMDNAGDAMLLIDERGKFLDVNPRACQMLGYAKEEMLNMSVPDIDVQWDPQKLDAVLKNMRPGVPLVAEGVQKKKSGEIFPVEVSTTLFEYQGKKMIMTLARDISVRKEEEVKLKQKTDELERLNALMVGRELKMSELKQEIEGLKRQRPQ